MTEVPLRYAGFWIRTLACVADVVILMTLATLVELAVLGVVFWAHRFKWIPPAGELEGQVLQLVSMAAYLILSVIYFTVAHARFGTTLGKVGLRIAVLDERTLGPLSWGQSFVRAAGSMFSWVLFVGYLMAACSAKKQALHDRLAGTVSVLVPPRRVLAGLAGSVTTWIAISLVMAGMNSNAWADGDEPDAWYVKNGRGPHLQLSGDWLTGLPSNEIRVGAAALFQPLANPWGFLGPRASYGTSSHEFTLGIEASFWLLNAIAPGISIDRIFGRDGAQARYQYGPWLAARLMRITRGGALSARIGVSYDTGEKWGFRAGILIQPWGVYNVATAGD